jgi:hypothetical protein
MFGMFNAHVTWGLWTNHLHKNEMTQVKLIIGCSGTFTFLIVLDLGFVRWMDILLTVGWTSLISSTN